MGLCNVWFMVVFQIKGIRAVNVTWGGGGMLLFVLPLHAQNAPSSYVPMTSHVQDYIKERLSCHWLVNVPETILRCHA